MNVTHHNSSSEDVLPTLMCMPMLVRIQFFFESDQRKIKVGNMVQFCL